MSGWLTVLGSRIFFSSQKCQNISATKCLGGKMSCLPNVNVFKCLSVKMSGWQNVCPSKCQNVKMLGCCKWVVCKMLGVKMSKNRKHTLHWLAPPICKKERKERSYMWHVTHGIFLLLLNFNLPLLLKHLIIFLFVTPLVFPTSFVIILSFTNFTNFPDWFKTMTM